MLTAHVYRVDGTEPSAHRVVNLSTSGACIVRGEDVAQGATVSVTIGQVENVAADIVWARGGLAGLRFRAPILLAAARMRRTGGGPPPPASGWLVAINNPYRRDDTRDPALHGRRQSDAIPPPPTRFTSR